MWDALCEIFSADAWIPLGQCGRWGAWATWYVLGQFAAAAAFFAIPPGLVHLWREYRTRFVFAPLFLSFGAFIAGCGATRLLDGAAFWWPAYRLTTVFVWFTAIAAWLSLVYSIRISKQLSAWRSPEEYRLLLQSRDASLEKSAAATKELERVIEDLRIQSQAVRQQLDTVKNELTHLQWHGKARQQLITINQQMDAIKESVARIGAN